MMERNMRSTSLLSVSLLALLCAGAAQSATLAEVKARGFITVGISSAPSPFGSVEDGKAAGFDAALIGDFGKAAGIEVRTQVLAPDEALAALQSGAIDVLGSTTEITPPRQEALAFDPVAETTRYYLKRKGDRKIAGVADLNGRRFGSMSNSDRLLDLAELENRLARTGAKLGDAMEYPTVREAADALVARRIDYVVGDIADLEEAVRAHPNDLEIGEPVSRKLYAGWATAKDNAEIGGMVADFLVKERQSGTLAALQEKFLGRPFADIPAAVTAADWWTAREKPAELPIPSIKQPD
jgi:polar amino acid transport system substrate-binding protein